MQASVRDCAIMLADCTVRYVLLVSYAFWTSSVRDKNESFKTCLTLVEIVQVTKSFLYIELENHYFEKISYILYYLFAGLLE